MIKVLYIIPANVDSKGNLKYSSFIRNEINSISKFSKMVEVEKYYLKSRINPIDILKSITELKKRIKLFKPNIIHAEVGSITSFISSFAKGIVPLVITFGGSDLLGFKKDTVYWKIRSSITNYMNWYSATKSNKIICVSEGLKNKISKKNINKTSVIPRGVDVNFFTPLNFEKTRHDLGWRKNERIILFNHSNASALVKNLPLAKNVIKILNNELKFNSRLEILENLTKKEVLHRMNASDVLLVTSFHEGSPNIVKESMACNLPIVSVNVGDIPERIQKCKNSAIVSYDPTEIAIKLKEIITNKEESNCREILINDGISNQETSRKLVNVYKECLI